MEETSWHSYPKVYALGHPIIRDLLKDEIIIQEKIDGSQFSFGVFNGQIKVRSKGMEMPPDFPEKMFHFAVNTVYELKDKLIDGWTYRAEFLRVPKHNCLKYERVPSRHLMLFDVNCGYESYLNYEELKKESARLELECVPLIYYGMLTDIDSLNRYLETDSILGGTKIEGVVIKNYKQFAKDGKALMGKFVSEAFKETNKTNWKKENPSGGDVIAVLCEKYKSPVRWQKTLFKLRDEGKLTHTLTDIGELLKASREDLVTECTEEIKEELYKWAMDKIKRSSTHGLPEWYKRVLLENQFGVPNGYVDTPVP